MTSLNASDAMASLSFPISSLEKNVSSSVTLDPSSSPVSFPTLSSTLLPSSNCTSAASPSSPPYNFYAVLLVLLIFCVVFGNVLVCIAVSRERALQTTTNYLIVSLAVSDLLLATLVMPWGVYLEVCCAHFCLFLRKDHCFGLIEGESKGS
ncbi:D(2) dopamine receptor-like [Oryzias melastigma]|uniref:D(2) dopamine receptor-like n=1 Tax=Oryzias melastigma TaxID=30732 RepID=UPI00168CC47E|nr:D(2) dopamine receptor-like [Oryzias melastigma]